MRRVVLVLALALLASAPTAAANYLDNDLWGDEDEIVVEGGPMRGRCISMRSAGIAISLAHCMPQGIP